MTKSTKPKRSPTPSRPLPSHRHTAELPSRGGSLLKTLGGKLGTLFGIAHHLLLWASVIVALIAGVFYFLPRVTVEPSGPYDPANPSPLTFTIANINIVPLRDVQSGVGLCYFTFSGDETRPVPTCNGPAGVIFSAPRWFVKWLDYDEKHEIIIEELFRAAPDPRKQIERADITIAVTYTPWPMPSIWPWRTTRQFRFVTKKLSDGKIYWIPVPLNR